MRIAILEHAGASTSATGVRGEAMASFLRGVGHDVDVIAPTPEDMRVVARTRSGLRARVARRLRGRATLPHQWELVADRLEPRLRRDRYDAVIARSQEVACVLPRKVAPVAIYDMANIGFLEEYYTWGPNFDEVEATWALECRVLQSVDYILSPHRLLTEYFLAQVDRTGTLAPKTITVRLGTTPAARFATYEQPPKIVYAGSYYCIQDPWLLAELTRDSRFEIHCYGGRDPNRPFLPARLAYHGFAPRVDFLADFQFGLITVSRDRLRQHSPASKFPYYLAHGLPVLFPEWMQEGYDYPQCAIPYNERTFSSQVASAADRARWQEMSEAARCLGRQLHWDIVLRPLADLLQSHPRTGLETGTDAR